MSLHSFNNQFDRLDYGDHGIDLDDQYDNEPYLLDTISLGASMEIRRQKSFDVFREEELKVYMQHTLREIMDILSLKNKTFALVLLWNSGWNKDKLVTQYLETGGEELRKLSGVNYLEDEATPIDGKYACPICFESVEGSETYALGCGHRYCKPCWNAFLKVHVKESNCVKTYCPFPKCGNIVHYKAFKTLCPESYDLYKKSVVQSVVSNNPHLKYCPSPNCNFVILCERITKKEPVVCDCGFKFCFKCSDVDIGDHVPANCEQIEAWLKKAMDDSENLMWMKVNAKKCPRCKKNIEKDGGCMHMTCNSSYGGCGHEFCWLCRGDWKDHGSETGGFYSCNKYDNSLYRLEDQNNEKLKQDLDTYVFYFHRYEAHHSAMKIADQQRRQASHRVEEIIKKFSSIVQDTKFLIDATDQLIENRKALAFSYVFGYYLDKNKVNEKNLFEFLQEDLEKCTDHLSALYERKLAKIVTQKDYENWKEQIINYTRVTEQFLIKFREGVMNGLLPNNR